MRHFLLLSIFLLGACSTEYASLQPGQARPVLQGTEQQLYAMSRKMRDDLSSKKKLLPNDHVVSRYVSGIGQEVARRNNYQSLGMQYFVINDKTANAFALPDGTFFFHTGLILTLENEAQLAMVVAHEIAHYLGRHSLENVSTAQKHSMLGQLAGIGLSAAGLGQLSSLTGMAANLANLSYSRDQEREADVVGFRMLGQAGYAVAEAPKTFINISKGGASKQPDFLSSHPNMGERIAVMQQTVRQLGDQAYQGRVGKKEYQRVKAVLGGKEIKG